MTKRQKLFKKKREKTLLVLKHPFGKGIICGCGCKNRIVFPKVTAATVWKEYAERRFITGHNSRVRNYVEIAAIKLKKRIKEFGKQLVCICGCSGLIPYPSTAALVWWKRYAERRFINGHDPKGKLWSKERKLKLSLKRRGKGNPMYGQAPTRRQLQSGHHLHFTNGFIDTIKGGRSYFRSGWEKTFIEILESSSVVKRFIVEPFPIKYRFQGKQSLYYPDFFIEMKNGQEFVVEIKGYVPTDLLRKNDAKHKAAERYCLANGMEFKLFMNMIPTISDVIQ